MVEITGAASAVAKALDVAAIAAITEIQQDAFDVIDNFIAEHTIVQDGTVTTDADTVVPGANVTSPFSIGEVTGADEGFAVRFETCRASGVENGWDWASDTCRP